MKNLIQVELGQISNSCFIVMPFSSIYQTEYEYIIKPALEELDIRCIRGDEIYSKQRIMDDIWASIRSSRFIIAELTGRNPNVLYEVGLAHAIGKPVIIITRNADDVPFDLKDLRYLYYDVNDPFWGENLKKGIQALVRKILENPDLENYLHGILKPTPIEYPVLVKTTKKTSLKVKNISGNWIGSFNLREYHGVTLNIDQNGDELSANAVITIGSGPNVDVVQQIMTGYVKGTKAFLKGVNYSFVQRKLLNNYVLDSFEFTSLRPKSISGLVTDEEEPTFHGTIALSKNEN